MLLKSKFQTTGRMIFLVTFICFCLLTITEINGHCKADNKFILFEKILTREVLLGNDVEKYPLSLDVYEENSVMRYIFEYKFEKKVPFQYYICTVSVAKAGRLIDQKRYEEEYNRFKEEYLKFFPEIWTRQLRIDFPEIGRQAPTGHLAVGPGGPSHGLLLTTPDGKFDIRIMICNLLPETIESPDLDIARIAKAISDRYTELK
jgi:hypothetical protein